MAILPAAVAAGLLEVVAGSMVVVGWRTRLAVLVLAAFTALASVLFHDFWNHAGREQINQLRHACKNVAMMGSSSFTVPPPGPNRSTHGERNDVRLTR